MSDEALRGIADATFVEWEHKTDEIEDLDPATNLPRGPYRVFRPGNTHDRIVLDLPPYRFIIEATNARVTRQML